MSILDLVAVINLILAFLALPPSIRLFFFVFDERGNVNSKQKKLNRSLIIMFGFISLISLGIGASSTLWLMGFEELIDFITPYQAMVISSLLVFISRSLFEVHKNIKSDK